MNRPSTQTDPDRNREVVVILAMTLLGVGVRLWSLTRLGLVHFDEGIYALAGLWVFSPRGLSGLDPTLIAYAPPGFPIVVGLAYASLGVGDLSAILVSIAAGTLTIPAVGWLACRTFGRGAGASASAFAAVSGPHVAFSRMALTDASFLLCWVIAIGQGQRFLERPNPFRALMLGIAVGVAQLFKYNGWLSGVFVAFSAALWLLVRREERNAKYLFNIGGWGTFAAIIAAIVYWPWFQFVESHGGYAALTAHHRSYLGNIKSWPWNLYVQLAQERALSGGEWWIASGGLLAALGAMLTLGAFVPPRLLVKDLVESLSFAMLTLLPHVGWWAALAWIIGLLSFWSKRATRAACLLTVGWISLALLTPFYHPYARLLLPLHAFGWLFLGGSLVAARSTLDCQGREAGGPTGGSVQRLFWFLAISLCAAVCGGVISASSSSKRRLPGPVEPSDSLRQACRVIAAEVPKDLTNLTSYARPPVTYYLAGTVPVSPQPNRDRLLRSGDRRTWALVDAAILRQESAEEAGLAALQQRWEIVDRVPSTLNLPTLLDVDPTAVIRGNWDASAPLLLLRPRPPGGTR